MAAFSLSARPTRMVAIAIAAISCAVMIFVVLLFAFTSTILPRDVSQFRTEQMTTNAVQEESHSQPIDKRKIRRRLLFDLLCPELNRPPPQLPSIPNLLQTSTYAASFPGSGYKLITKHLVESITGMLVGDASTSPSLERMKVQKMDRTGYARGQGEVIVLQTHFPHTSGKLSPWDDYLPRAFIVLRNPLHAIPSYFDQLLNMKSHQPASGSSAEIFGGTLDAWIKWRDGELSSQLQLYREFVSFWMEKYSGRDDKRVLFSYESLADDEEGAQEAIRLATFLLEGVKANAMETPPKELKLGPVSDVTGAVREAIEMFVNIEEIPCVWRDIVRTAIPDGNSNNFGSRGGDESPSKRPFTPENLLEISEMLSGLTTAWSHHERVWRILSGYQREVSLGNVWRPPQS